MEKLKRINKRYQKFKLGISPQQNLLYGFLSYVFIGTLLLALPIFQKAPIAFLDSLFMATSAVSTTGLVTVPLAESYNLGGQLILLSLFQLGGIGYLTFTTFVILSTTRKITHWHQKILKTEFAVPKTITIGIFLKSVILFTVIMEFLGTVLLTVVFTQEGQPFWTALYNGFFHSVSAFCTAGFSLFGDGFMSYTANGWVNVIISLLAISGSLGFIVITDFYLLLRYKAHKLSFTTKIILFGFLFLLASGTILVFALEPSINQLEGKERFLAAFFQTMSAMTTVGFNSVDFGDFSQAILLVIIFLMYVGASPSGTAGGIKITTLTALIAILKSRIQGNQQVTFLGKAIPQERLSIATSSFIFYSSILVLGCFVITLTNHHKFENLFFEVASALGTVGLSTGITSQLDVLGKLTLIVLMFIGRLGVLTFGFALWHRNNKLFEPCEEEDIAL